MTNEMLLVMTTTHNLFVFENEKKQKRILVPF